MGCGAAVGQGDISGVREHQWGVCGVGGRQWGGGGAAVGPAVGRLWGCGAAKRLAIKALSWLWGGVSKCGGGGGDLWGRDHSLEPHSPIACPIAQPTAL